jgi:hypothetical protein
MKITRFSTHKIVGVLVGALTALFLSSPSWSCGGIVLPAPCTEKLVRAMAARANQQVKDLKELAKKVRADNNLHIDEAEELLTWSHTQTGIAFIKDSELRREAEAATPIAIARRIETRRSALSPKEWKKVTAAWANYLHEGGEALEGYDPKEFCSMHMEAASLAVDGGMTGIGVVSVVAMPFLISNLNTNKKLIALPALVGLGAILLAGDVATFVPNVAANKFEELKNNRHLKQSAQALSKFAAVASNYDKETPTKLAE